MTFRSGFILALVFGCSIAVAAEHKVSSADEIHKALKDAKPGDVLVLSDGEWKDQSIKFEAKGTKDQPITLRAQTPGQVKLIGNSSLTFNGDFLVASGLFFGESTSTDSAVAFNGNDNRFTDGAIVAPDRGGKWVHFKTGQRNRLDHCYLEGHAPADVTVQVEIDKATPNFARIDHNHFGPRPPLGKNGGETIRVGYSGQQDHVAKTLVEHNLFDRCDGEIEVISNKSTDSTYRYNTFRHCEGTLTLRHGGKATVDGNFFIGRPDGKSGGIRVIGHGHTIVNNYFENCAPTAGGVIALTCAMREPKPTDYQHVNGGLVAFNTIVNCGLPYVRLDAGFAPDRTRDVLPKDVVVANNLFVHGGETAAKNEGGAAGKHFVHGQEGPGFKWAGNIAHGADVGDAGSAKGGIKAVDPKLVKGDDGVVRPATDGPVRGAAAGDVAANVETDIDVQPRGEKKDVGADQVSDAPVKNKPLQPGDVGPAWRRTDKTASARVTNVRTATYAAQATQPGPTPVPSFGPAPAAERTGREPIYFEAHKDLFLRYERETRSFVMKGPSGWQATSVTLCPAIVDQRTVWAATVAHEDSLGKAVAFEVQSDAGEQRFWTYPNLPLLFTRVTVRNTSSHPIEIADPVVLALRLSPARATTHSAGTVQTMRIHADGADATPLDRGATGKQSLAITGRKDDAGVAAGWVGSDGHSAVDASYDGRFTVVARGARQPVTIAPGVAYTSGTFAIGFSDDARETLRRLGGGANGRQ